MSSWLLGGTRGSTGAISGDEPVPDQGRCLPASWSIRRTTSALPVCMCAFGPLAFVAWLGTVLIHDV